MVRHHDLVDVTEGVEGDWVRQGVVERHRVRGALAYGRHQGHGTDRAGLRRTEHQLEELVLCGLLIRKHDLNK